MYSDGKISHIQFFKHPETSHRAPAALLADWVAVGEESVVGNPDQDSSTDVYVTAARIAVAPFQTRYLLVRARNDGRYGCPSYIEFRAVKVLFWLPADPMVLT
jgi:hypothetical protein